MLLCTLWGQPMRYASLLRQTACYSKQPIVGLQLNTGGTQTGQEVQLVSDLSSLNMVWLLVTLLGCRYTAVSCVYRELYDSKKYTVGSSSVAKNTLLMREFGEEWPDSLKLTHKKLIWVVVLLGSCFFRTMCELLLCFFCSSMLRLIPRHSVKAQPSRTAGHWWGAWTPWQI